MLQASKHYSNEQLVYCYEESSLCNIENKYC